MDWKLHEGDCLEVLPTLEAGSIDAVVTDPPYGLEFMGRDWDAPWKPGAGGMSSVGFRTKVYKDGSTAQLPVSVGGTNPTCRNCGGCRNGREGKKGQQPCRCESPRFDNVTLPRMRAFQRWCEDWATAVLRVLSPGGYMLCFGGTRTYHRLACAVEDAGFEVRDCLMWIYGQGFPKGDAQLKPAYEPILLCRRPAARVSPLDIDGCRVPTGESTRRTNTSEMRWSGGWGSDGSTYQTGSEAGRWPANVLHDGSDEVLEAFAAFGNTSTTGKRSERSRSAAVAGTAWGTDNHQSVEYPNEPPGTAARFFYCAKASRAERGEGNSHPTVKPLALMRWLVRLVTPEGGVVLDPFAGSGTTALAATAEDRRAVLIEREPAYCDIIRRRMADSEARHPLFANQQPETRS